MNTAQSLIAALENEGIRYIFGVPGEENLDILEAIRTSKNIEFIVTRHEQAAGFMAATIGRMSGTPAVALSTLGPGATNLVTAAAYAQLGAMPLLMITGQKPIKHSKQGAFQIIDVVDMMKPITKFSKQLVEGSMVYANVREAVRIASEERPGAALLEIPEDIAAETVNEGAKPIPISHTRRPIAEQKAINQAVELLMQAKRPLVLVGAGANRKRTSNMLTQLVSECNIPFFTTQMGKGVIDESLPQFAGTAALTDGDFVHETVKASDLILMVGHDIVEKPPFIVSGKQKIIHINFASASINDIYYPDSEVVGDIANSIWQIKEALRAAPTPPTWETDYHRASKGKLDAQFAAAVDSAKTITPQIVVASIRHQLPRDGICALDNGMFKIWFARHYVTHSENTLLLDNALATMGAGLPSAIAAKMLYPEREVIAVCGDGGFMMNSQELETALRLKLDLTVVILNDNSYKMIRWKQAKQDLADFGLQFNNPDFVAYAESYDAKGFKATTPEELGSVLEQCSKAPGVKVIDVQIDYSQNDSSI